MSLTPISNLTIISGHRTLADQLVLRARGVFGRNYLAVIPYLKNR